MSETQEITELLGGQFWQSLYVGLQGVYNRLPEMTAGCPDLVSKDYACQIRGFEAQKLLFETAIDYGYVACGVPNSPNTAHHVEVLVHNEVLVTIQFSPRKYELGIPAYYREEYARGTQTELLLCDRPQALASRATRYLLIVHGAMNKNPFELGFIQSGIPHPNLKRFVEPPVNIDSYFSQNIQIPQVAAVEQPQVIQIRRKS